MAAFTLNNNLTSRVNGLTRFAYTLDLTAVGEGVGALGTPIILERLYFRSTGAVSGFYLQLFDRNALPVTTVTVPTISIT